MVNLQNMADCCDCLIRYSEITSLWGVIVQKPTNTIAMDINDSNMVSAIQISPIDLSNSFNIIEVKFPDSSAQDNFNSASFDLAVINPALLFPNEPLNKMSISLPLVNNDVQAQYIASVELKQSRVDRIIEFRTDFSALGLQAGDLIDISNDAYGFNYKVFRITRIVEDDKDDGTIELSITALISFITIGLSISFGNLIIASIHSESERILPL